jgi:hypothetical protein
MMAEAVEVEFDAAKVRRLRRAYICAVSHSQEVFAFEGAEYLVKYAHYLLIMLEQRFKP